MPEENDNGGYVYPPYISNMDDEEYFEKSPNIRGITRRDWLAGLAMQSLLANEINVIRAIETAEKFNKETPEIIAILAYKNADAMIAKSNK